MNRAERRREEKRGINKAHIMQRYREEAYEQGWHDGMREEIDITFNLLSYTLTYKTGYSVKRIKELLHSLYFNIDSFRTRTIKQRRLQNYMRRLGEKRYHFT